MGPGCGEVTGGGMSAGMGCMRVFNSGDDGEGKIAWGNGVAAGLDERKQPEGWTVGQNKIDLAQMHPHLNMYLSEFVGIVSVWFSYTVCQGVGIPGNWLICDMQCN